MYRCLLTTVSLVLLLACPARAAKIEPPSVPELSFARTQVSDQRKFVVTLDPLADPLPINQIHAWQIKLATADGAAVSKATFHIGGGMPEHGHGFPTRPRVIETAVAGTYLMEGMKFSMHGRWEIKFAIQAGDVSDIVSFNTMVALPESWSTSDLAVLASLRLSQLPPPPHDPSNAFERNPAAAALGKRLFFDPRFSRNGAVSCSSCHDPNQHFQDGRPLAQGIGLASRRTQPIVGAGHSPWLFWDGRKDSLWSQALAPMEDPLEHGSNRTRVAQLIEQHYRREYEAVFGTMAELPAAATDASPLGSASEAAAWNAMEAKTQEDVSRIFANVGKAIAAFEKSLEHTESRFDRYVSSVLDKKKTSSLTPREINGLRIFIGRGRCVTCHAGPLFTDHHFHSTRVPARDPANPDQGRAGAVRKIQQDEFNCLGRYSDARPAQCEELRYIVTNDPAILRAFKTPGLRNVALRPPYMHAGQLATLRDVIRHYVKAPDAALGPAGMVHRLGLNSELQPLPISEKEIDELIAFLGSLSSEVNAPAESRR